MNAVSANWSWYKKLVSTLCKKVGACSRSPIKYHALRPKAVIEMGATVKREDGGREEGLGGSDVLW